MGIVSSKSAWATEPDPVSNIKMLRGRVFLEGVEELELRKHGTEPILQPQLILVRTLNPAPFILRHVPSHPASQTASHQDHHPEQASPWSTWMTESPGPWPVGTKTFRGSHC